MKKHEKKTKEKRRHCISEEQKRFHDENHVFLFLFHCWLFEAKYVVSLSAPKHG